MILSSSRQSRLSIFISARFFVPFVAVSISPRISALPPASNRLHLALSTCHAFVFFFFRERQRNSNLFQAAATNLRAYV